MKKKIVSVLLIGCLMGTVGACGNNAQEEGTSVALDVTEKTADTEVKDVKEETEQTEETEQIEEAEQTEVAEDSEEEQTYPLPTQIQTNDVYGVTRTYKFEYLKDEKGDIVYGYDINLLCNNTGDPLYGTSTYKGIYRALPLKIVSENARDEDYEMMVVYHTGTDLYVYDDSNRLTQIQYSGGYLEDPDEFSGVIDFVYEGDVVSAVEYVDGGMLHTTVTLDSNNNLSSYVHDTSWDGFDDTHWEYVYEYNEQGDLISSKFSQENGSYSSDSSSSTDTYIYSYDEQGRMLTMTEYSYETLQYSIVFTYDEEGRVTEETFFFENDEHNRTYEYDENGYLLTTTVDGEMEWSFVYDGNCLVSGTHNKYYIYGGYFLRDVINRYLGGWGEDFNLQVFDDDCSGFSVRY